MTSDILIYQNQEGNIKIDVRLQEETVWLTQAQMATLFGKDKRTISEHISNIFSEGELMKIQLSGISGQLQQTVKICHQPLQFRCYHFGWVSGKVGARHTVPYLGNTALKGIHHQRLYAQ